MTRNHLQLREVRRDIHEFSLGPISLDVEPGLIYAIVGPNGSGKSTLFKLMMGLIRPESGRVTRFDQPLSVGDQDQSRRIAFVPETLNGHDTWSVGSLVEMYRRSYPRFDPTFLSTTLDVADYSKSFSGLSKGQQRRLMLTLAMASRAEMMLFDEPTDGLDPFVRQSLLNELTHAMEDGDRSIVLATHNLEDVRRIADVVVLISNGKHVGTWNKDDVLEGWQRVTLEHAPKLPLDGEMTRTEGARVQIVSNDISATLAHAETLGIRMIQHQPIDMVESLRILLESDGVSPDRQTLVTNGIEE